jgi:hypothetical protein
MKFFRQHPNPTLAFFVGMMSSIERTHAHAAIERRNSEARDSAALSELKHLAVQHAVLLVKLKKDFLFDAHVGLNDSDFKEEVQKEACSLLLRAHLELSD